MRCTVKQRRRNIRVLIVGAGPAGLTAAVYCARKMLKTMIISENIGGQALESWAIENYMGYRMITGEDLMKKFEEQVRTLNIRFELDHVNAITKERIIIRVTNSVGQCDEGQIPDPYPGKPSEETGLANEENISAADFRSVQLARPSL